MTLQEAYPRAVDAVVLHERHGGEGMWKSARDNNWPPDDARRVLLISARQVRNSLGRRLFTDAVMEQMETNDFLRYVAAKLGAM